VEAVAVTAFKFLAPGRIGPFSGVRWPVPSNGEPADWVAADGPLEPCRNGVHACRMGDLPFWLDAELWVVELDGDVVESDDVLVASRGRLVERVVLWETPVVREYAHACVGRAREHADTSGDERAAAYARDAAGYEAAGGRPKMAALIACAAAYAAETARPGGLAEERRWQANWLARRLGLTTAAG
jgi:hypothetical protein